MVSGLCGGAPVILSGAKDRAGGRSEPRAPLSCVRRSFAALRTTGGIGILLLSAGSHPLAAQHSGQQWDVSPQAGRVTVGDTISLRFRLRLDERDLLFDSVPRPAVTPPGWVRILSVEKLRRQPDRLFIGLARIAFYRPGPQQVPIFQLPFMRSVKGLSRGTVSSDTATIEVEPVLTAGASARLRDIKEPAPVREPDPRELLLGLAALGAAGWLAWRARHRALPTAPEPAPAVALEESAAPDPYETALARLASIEAERWPERDVARHYEAVADVLRDYLEAHGVPARERTTSELRWALPPALLSGSAGRRFEEVFEPADLVKFARRRPDAPAAAAFLILARELLARWRDAVPAREMADAVR